LGEYIEVHAFSPDGERAFVVNNQTGRVQLLSLRALVEDAAVVDSITPDKLTTWPKGLPLAVSFGPQGVRVLVKMPDNSLKLWEPGRATRELENLVGDLFDATFSEDGTRLAALGQDGTVAIWDVRTGKKILSFPSGFHLGMTSPLALSRDGTRLMVAGVDKTARIYPTSREAFFRVARTLLND
jgi:WD40 repeat protein